MHHSNCFFINVCVHVVMLSSILSNSSVGASQVPMLGEMAFNNDSRIRIKSTQDVIKANSLLQDYLNKPSLASSVKEFVFDKQRPDSGGCFLSPPPGDEKAPKRNEIVNDSQYSQEEDKIIDSLSRIGLSVLSKRHTWAVGAIKKWRKSHIAQVGTMEGPTEWQRQYSQDRSTNADYAQVLGPLLISLSPNLERLHFTTPAGILQDFLLKVNYGILPPDCLQNLRHVTFGPSRNGYSWRYDERFYNRYDVLGMTRLVHKLPSIESISVQGISEDDDSATPRFIPPGTSNLKRLHIGHSDISSDILSSLIRMAKALEEVSVSVGGRDSNDGGFHVMYVKTIGKSLLCHKDSLISLDLDLDEHHHSSRSGGSEDEQEDCNDPEDEEVYEGNLENAREDKYFQIDEALSQSLRLPLFAKDLPDTRKYRDTIGSLHDFTALTRLSIGVKLLLGPQVWNSSTQNVSSLPAPFRLIDALPLNLKFLCVRGYKAGEDEHWDDQINELMANRAAKLPALVEVLGIEKEIPSGKSVDRPDDDGHLLWMDPQDEADKWEEWGLLGA